MQMGTQVAWLQRPLVQQRVPTWRRQLLHLLHLLQLLLLPPSQQQQVSVQWVRLVQA